MEQTSRTNSYVKTTNLNWSTGFSSINMTPTLPSLKNETIFNGKALVFPTNIFQGDTVDGSEIPRPTTWPCKKTTVNHGINLNYLSLNWFSPRISHGHQQYVSFLGFS